MKEKKTNEQILKERRDNALLLIEETKYQLKIITERKNTIYEKLVECKKKGLKEQELQARNRLRQYLATEKRYEGMIMSIELALDAATLNNLNSSFMNTINELSLSITPPKMAGLNMKKVKNNFLKGLYNVEETRKRTDEMLELGEYNSAAEFGSESYTEFDTEIDNLLKKDPEVQRIESMKM